MSQSFYKTNSLQLYTIILIFLIFATGTQLHCDNLIKGSRIYMNLDQIVIEFSRRLSN